MPDDLHQLQALLNYQFKNPALLELALTHPSLAKLNNCPNQHYQRLEFLGDSVLSLALTQELFHFFPDEREGTLARYRAALIRGTFLTSLAKQLHLHHFIKANPGEFSKPEDFTDSILEDVFEAVLGAIFLDSDFPTANKIILNIFGNIKVQLLNILQNDNPKGNLQETVQQNCPEAKIAYHLEKTSGPPHQRHFTMSVSINNKKISTGSASSKKTAEERAAAQALKEIRTLFPLNEVKT